MATTIQPIKFALLSNRLLPIISQIHRLSGDYKHGNPAYQPRYTRNKFSPGRYSPRFKRERILKLPRLELPYHNPNINPEDMTPGELRRELKAMGREPSLPWKERDVTVMSTNATIDEYIPPEGDGKAALLTQTAAKQKMELVTRKGRAFITMQKIKRYDENFKTSTFPEVALEVYKNMHYALMKFEKEEILKYCTEYIYPIVTHNLEYKTMRWSFIGNLEPPRIVHCRHANILKADNLFAQVTVRFHTQQTLAIYDRFGRLINGSEIVARDVLEYVVFEKHISNTYGAWRVHHKIIPEWSQQKNYSYQTFVYEEEEEEIIDDDDDKKAPETESKETEKNVDKEKPAFA